MTKKDLIEQFGLKDVSFMTADEKAMVLMAWDRFLKNGCKFEDFTDRLYKHLSLNCEFIAHFDRMGFYSVYFKEPQMTVKFVKQFDPEGDGMAVEYHMDGWLRDVEHADVNEAMRKIMGKYALHLVKNALTWDKEMDCREIERLMRKHDISTYTIKS